MRQWATIREIAQYFNQLQTTKQALAAQGFVFFVIFFVNSFQAHSEVSPLLSRQPLPRRKKRTYWGRMLLHGPHQVKLERRIIFSSEVKTRNIPVTL
ncbi:hypothetical protein D3C79_624010 [compost metagenome]